MVKPDINNNKQLVYKMPGIEGEEKTGQTGITIMLASDKNYLYPAMVLLTSLFHNHRNQKVVVYLLYMGFSKEDLDSIYSFADTWSDKEICCIEVTNKELGGLKAFGRFSEAAYFRILGMYLLPGTVKKVLYLDVDMVVNNNLSELFSMQMNKPITACYDINNYLQGNIEYHKAILGIPEQFSYFNSGMLVMDLEYMRNHSVAGRLLADIEEHFEMYALVDQDALNKFFYYNTEWLPWQKYNCPCVPVFSTVQKPEGIETLIVYKEILENSADIHGYDITSQLVSKASIIHFCTSQKPWRDRDFYERENMKEAMKIYQRYERLYIRKSTNRQE